MTELRVGTAKVDITPPLGVELCGYGIYLQRKARVVHDSLYSRAVVMVAQAEKIALVANDLIALARETVARTRILIHQLTGIKEDKILLCASHTHSGPVTIPLRGWGEPTIEYIDTLPAKIAHAVLRAIENLKEAKIGFGKGKLETMSFNRVEAPSFNQMERVGTIDPEVSVIRIDDLEGRPLAILFNFPCHGVVIDFRTPEGKAISGDFPGWAERILEKENEGAVALFLQGACGDINPRFVRRSFKEVAKTGRALAKVVSNVLKNISLSSQVEMKIIGKEIKLPLDIPSREEMKKMVEEKMREFNQYSQKERSEEARQAKFSVGYAAELLYKLKNRSFPELTTEIQALRINDALMVSIPGELFVKFGLKIKKELPYPTVLVVGYANDFVGYIPTPEDFEKGGYAARVVPWIAGNFPFVPNVGSILVKEVLSLARCL